MDFSQMEIHLIEGADRVLPPMSEKASRSSANFLKKLGVQIHLNTIVTNYENNKVTTNTDLELTTATFVWSAGVTGAPVQGVKLESLIPRANRYKVNEYNRVDGYQDIFAIGDIAELLAKNLLRISKGESPKPFEYNDKGSMATIGRNKAVVDIGKLRFGGFFAWFIWMFIHLLFLVGFRNKIVTLFNWVYNYINFDKASRLIVRPFKNEEIIDQV